MFRKFFVCSIVLSMNLFIFAVDQNNGDFVDNISFVTISNEDKEIFAQTESVEHFTLQKNVDGMMHYAIGARRAIDHLVASGGGNQSWPQPHNVKVVLSYPQQGVGANISYVAIVVNQTSNLGQAYVIKGGINQRQISVVVEAYNTLVFNVLAYIYGF